MVGTLTDKVRAYCVTPIQQLAIGTWPAAKGASHSLEEVDFQRLFSGPGRREDAATLGQIIQLGVSHNFDELFAVHNVPPFPVIRCWILGIGY
jgi:hypothetical protein